MAEITLRLIWYKLGEVSEKMAEAGRTWYTELDFDSYVLDLILLSWCSVCVLVMVAVNAIASSLGPYHLRRKQDEKWVGSSSTDDERTSQLPIETCQWFNNALNWFYLHYYYSPEFVDDWVRSLNEELVKLGGPVPAKIEQVQNGSLPPRVTHVSCEASPKDKFIIHARVESRDLAFQLFASQQTQQGVKLTNCTASVLRLKGTIRVESYRDKADIRVRVNFESSKPEIKLLVKPNNPYQEENELVDLGVVEENIRHAIGLAKTVLTVTHLLMPGDLETVGHDTKFEGYGGIQGSISGGEGRASVKKAPLVHPPAPLATSTPATTPTSAQGQRPRPVEEAITPASAGVQRSAPPQRQEYGQTPTQRQLYEEEKQLQQLQQQRQLQQQQHQYQQQQQQQQAQAAQRRDQQQRVKPQSRPEGVFEPVETSRFQSSHYSAPPKPPRMVGDKRLLVKVIKANGLTLQDQGSSSVVCMVSTDEPVQGYGTSMVRNTVHPFWDEHFLFDITHDTQEVHVEIYDTARPQGDDFVGESIVYVEDLRKNPSSRQILRLHPDPERQEYNSGSVTAEFLFMDPHEADLLLDSMSQQQAAQLSPRRRIEVERSAAPGGTVIMTTTTTERSPFGRHEPGLDGSPNYIEKTHADDSMRFSYNDSSSNVSSEYRQHPIPTVEGPTDEDLDPSQRPYGGQGHEKDDLELERRKKEAPPSPSLKKSRTLGGSLKKLFRRGRKRSQGRGGDNSRDNSLSRESNRTGGSKGASRDNSLNRSSDQRGYERASSVS